MTEKEIQKLGFEQQVETSDPSFYYYTLDIVDGLSFITQANDEVENGEWIAEIFETTPAIKFKDAKKLSNFIEILNQNKENERT
jgi:thymidine phosphorylase